MTGIDCGIDIGSTNLKIVLVSEDGTVLYTRSVPSPRVFDDFGPVTDGLALVAQLEDMIIEGWRQVGSGMPLRSIAAAGVGEDGMAVAADLTPLGPAIPWFDRRAQAEAAELEPYATYRPQTGIAIGPDRTVAKWLWLARHRPQQVDGAAHWIALTDFPAAWWTGRPFMSASLAPRTACYDVHARRWIEPLLKTCAAPPLPNILSAGQVVGRVRRGRLLDSGAASLDTVVAAAGHDHPVAAALIRRQDPTGIVDSLGTANLLYGETASVNGLDVDDRLALSLPPDGSAGIACLGVLAFSAALSEIDPEAVRSYLADATLKGEPPSHEDEQDLPSTAIVIRRILERECLAARRILDSMAVLGVPDGQIYTTGGWARSAGFIDLRAGILGRPIKVIADREMSALGAAAFAYEAATGKLACAVEPNDIKTREPVADWARRYDVLYAQMREREGSGSSEKRER